MDLELRRRVDALRRPLELAAADGFAGVRRVQGLGHALRNACDGILAQAPEDAAAFAQWRSTLVGWEALDEHQQTVEVARGMRLVARYPRPSVAPPPIAPTFAIPKSAPIVQRATVQAAPVPKPAPKATTMEPLAVVEAPKKKKLPVPTVDVDPLALPTHSLPGIGPTFSASLAEKGLATVEDLIWLVPRRYDDVRGAQPLAEVAALADGERATFVARVMSSRMVFARGRRWGEVRLTQWDGAPASAVVRWFNMFAGIDKRVPVGSRVVLSGAVKRRDGRLELANPDILGVEDIAVADAPASGAPKPPKPLPAILARYPDIPGVPAGRLRSACAAACARVADAVEDGVPAVVERAANLPSLGETVAQLHAPPATTTAEDLAAMNLGASRWQRRLAFGELFALGVAVALRRRERRADAAVACPRKKGFDAALRAALPFAPTGAQTRAIGELGDDLARPTPMNRLLQGDVGSGKTAVAFAAALQVARAGRQTAVMAPTELLAEQHAETWKRWSATSTKVRLRVELLTASTPRPVRASLLAMLAAGEVDVLIGTHSLLGDGVGFAALGLVVIDEQHRFGVAQRAKLRDKGDGQGSPHLLVMTATPIPRTLALTAYGDLDASILDELPPGRTPIVTRLAVGARGCAAAYKLIGERVAAGERAYVVCPKVEPSEPDDRHPDDPKRTYKDATTTADELAAALPKARVGLVHGRLDAAARDRVMRAFKDGELDVLCATTVIEVGVDVPAATVMVVHDAERFGLAQLHQLRGRVGRGGGASQCVLLSQGSLGEDGEQRLGALVASTDGFLIAETDLALRGAGELLGARQAGIPRLRFGDLATHTQLLLEARRHAEAVLVDDPDLAKPEHGALRRALERRLANHVYGPEAG